MHALVKDLTGEKFFKLTAKSPTNKRKYGAVIWNCECECGGTKEVMSSDLLNGTVQSCGCIKRGRPSVDLTGQTFGLLTVIRATSKRERAYVVWECKCTCGTLRYVNTNYLQAGNGKVCRCENADNAGTETILGKKYGRYTVKKKLNKMKQRQVLWQAECECGHRRNFTIKELTLEPSTCRCTKRKDITGQRFGKLVALRPLERRIFRAVVWEVQCDCGNLKELSTVALNSGVQSCGCMRQRVPGTRDRDVRHAGRPMRDLANQKFGKLTALYPLEERYKNQIVWHCLCDCGNTKDVPSGTLGKSVQSCGCAAKKVMTIKRPHKDLTNEVFGKLTVIHILPRKQGQPKLWHCKCECGNTKDVPTSSLNGGHTQSCGCLGRGRPKKNKEGATLR